MDRSKTNPNDSNDSVLKENIIKKRPFSITHDENNVLQINCSNMKIEEKNIISLNKFINADKSITSLNLSDCDLTDDMLGRILVTKNIHPSLKALHLSKNNFEWKDKRISNFMIKNKIEVLIVNNLLVDSDEALNQFKVILSSNFIKNLTINTRFSKKLINFLNLNNSLTTLRLYNNGLDDSVVDILGKFIEDSPCIHTLNLAANPFKNIKPICNALKYKNKTLRNLALTEIPAKKHGLSIGDALTENNSLIAISFGHWGMKNEDLSDFFNLLKKNKSIIGVGTTNFVNRNSILFIAECLKENDVLKSFKYMKDGWDEDTKKTYSYEEAIDDLKKNVSEERLRNFKLVKGCI